MPLCCALIFIGVSGPSLGERRLKIGATHPSSGTRDLPGACGLGQVKARGGGEGLQFFSTHRGNYSFARVPVLGPRLGKS